MRGKKKSSALAEDSGLAIVEIAVWTVDGVSRGVEEGQESEALLTVLATHPQVVESYHVNLLRWISHRIP